ncbi:hypothetical protein BDN72DRAFT_906146, partial [Pluteus cervinus]
RSAGGDAEITKDSVLEICSEPGRQVLEHNAVADFVAEAASETGDPPLTTSLPDQYVPPLPSFKKTTPAQNWEDSEDEDDLPPVSSGGTQSVVQPTTGKRRIRSGQSLCLEAWKVKNVGGGKKPHRVYWNVLTEEMRKDWDAEYDQRAKHMSDQEAVMFSRSSRIQALL